MNVPVTDAYYADYWAHVEALDLPIVWHVADPEEFWDIKTLPAWARDRGWGYGPDDVTKGQLYAEVNAVLARHPRLRITFAHFYFLSADLGQARRFLDTHPRVCLDLTPGIEMLYNLSRDPDTSRDFFIDYADRVIFGTDIASRNTVDEGRFRAGLVYRWLETQDTFRVPSEADFLLGQPDDGVIRGMALPDDVLERIYQTNFTRLVGGPPRELNVSRAVSLCTRIGAIAQGMSGTPAEDSEAIRIARYLDQAG
jgi:predicted TIM-barrel fold metal-dependent hydrolase